MTRGGGGGAGAGVGERRQAASGEGAGLQTLWVREAYRGWGHGARSCSCEAERGRARVTRPSRGARAASGGTGCTGWGEDHSRSQATRGIQCTRQRLVSVSYTLRSSPAHRCTLRVDVPHPAPRRPAQPDLALSPSLPLPQTISTAMPAQSQDQLRHAQERTIARLNQVKTHFDQAKGSGRFLHKVGIVTGAGSPKGIGCALSLSLSPSPHATPADRQVQQPRNRSPPRPRRSASCTPPRPSLLSS